MKRNQEIIKHFDALVRKLGDDIQYPTKLHAIRHTAETRVAGYGSINEKSRGHSGLPQLFLYPAVLDLSRVTLKQELRFSKSAAGPYGQLIDFFLAVVKPLLGAKTPTKSAVAYIITEARKTLDPEHRAMKQREERRKHLHAKSSRKK